MLFMLATAALLTSADCSFNDTKANTSHTFMSKTGLLFDYRWEDLSLQDAHAQAVLKSLFTRSFLQGYRSCGAFSQQTDHEICEYLSKYFNEFVAPRYRDPSLLFLTAKIKERCVGFAIFEKSGEDEIYVAEFAIDPEFWLQGLGRTFMDLIIDKEPNVKKVSLITERINKRAQAFYESLGFEPSKYMHEGYSASDYCAYEKHYHDGTK